MDLDLKRMVFVAPTRPKDTLKGFLEFLRNHNGNPGSVGHFSCYLSGAYAQGIREHFPHATVTTDRFLWLKNQGGSEREGTNPSGGFVGSSRLCPDGPRPHPEGGLSGPVLHEAEGGGTEPGAVAPLGLPQPIGAHGEAGPDVPEAEVRYSPVVSTRISNGLLEGLNSLFKMARAKARGYRSLQYRILAFYLAGGRFELQLPRFNAVTHTKIAKNLRI